jgi:hypothetical protein
MGYTTQDAHEILCLSLDSVVSFSTHCRDSYCLKGSVIFRLSKGIIINGAKSDADVTVGVVLNVFIMCYLDLEWLDLCSNKWCGRKRKGGSGDIYLFSEYSTAYLWIPRNLLFSRNQGQLFQKVKRPERETDQ